MARALKEMSSHCALVAVALLAMTSVSAAFSTSIAPVLSGGSARSGFCALSPAASNLPSSAAFQARTAPLAVTMAKKKAASDPDKPKRPLSAYFLFTAENRAKVKAADPSLSNTEIVKKLGEMWRGLPDASKAPYTDAAAKAKAEYDAKYKVEKEKTPKRPLSAYMLFSNAVRPKVKAANPSAAFGEIAKMIGAQWREMPPSAKQEWLDAEAKGKKEFEALNK